MSLVPDVFDTRIASAARVGAADEIAQARRSAVRALAVARRAAARKLMLGRADQEAGARVRRLVQRAERGFRHAGDGVSADRLAAWYAGWTPDAIPEGPASPLLSEMVAEAAPDLFGL